MTPALLLTILPALPGQEVALGPEDLEAIAAEGDLSALSPLRRPAEGIATGAVPAAVSEALRAALRDPTEVWDVVREPHGGEEPQRAETFSILVRDGAAHVLSPGASGLRALGPFEAADPAAFVAGRLGLPRDGPAIDLAAAPSERERAVLIALGRAASPPVAVSRIADSLPAGAGVAPGEVPAILEALAGQGLVRLARSRPEPLWEAIDAGAARTLAFPLVTIAVRRRTAEGTSPVAALLTSEHGTLALDGAEITGLGSRTAESAAAALRVLRAGARAAGSSRPGAAAAGVASGAALRGDAILAEVRRGEFRNALATSTRDAFGRGRADTWTIDDLVEYQDTTGSGSVDFVKVDDHGAGSWTRAFVLRDETWEPTNITDVFLEVEFRLPWARSAYRPHDVRVLLNGKEIARLEDTIPEGYYRFPIRPLDVRLPGDPGGSNEVVLATTHLRGGHYVVSNDFNLYFHLIQVSRWIAARSEEEAVRLLEEKGRLRTKGADAVVYSNEWKLSNDRPAAGAPVRVSGVVWNLGAEAIEGARLVLADGKEDVVSADLPPLPPGLAVDAAVEWKPAVGDRRHELRVEAKGDLRPENNSLPVIVRSGGDQKAPELAISAPKDGGGVPAGPVAVSGTATDDLELARVECSVDGGLWQDASLEGETWELRATLGAGEHSVRIRAVDRSGNATEARITFTAAGS